MENSDYAYAYASEPVWVGIKRGHEARSEGKLEAALMEKRYRCDDENGGPEHPRWKHVAAAHAPTAGAKRRYEQPEDDVEAELVDKRYKCNYWEDPACAKLLQLRGGRKAKHAARLNHTYRLIKETDDWCAATLSEAACKNLFN
jgi:hypothetical protein